MSVLSPRWKMKIALHKRGISLLPASRAGEEFTDLARFLAHLNVQTVVDVGANVGQFAAKLFHVGFPGKIISFEPMPDEHGALVRNSARNDSWVVAPPMAVSDRNGLATLNVAGNSISSSLLPMGELHGEVAPRSRYVRQIEVKVDRLDAVLPGLLPDGDFFLKIDTQGTERLILEGAEALHSRIAGIKTEMSFASLYEGQTVFDDLYPYIADLGYDLWDITPGLRDNRTGRLLQCDAVFVKSTCRFERR